MRRRAQGCAAMYQECHLGPGVEPTPLHLGLNPTAPELLQAHDRGPKYLFWTIKHGIRMTGMPAWGVTHADEELWDVVAFLQRMPTMRHRNMRIFPQAPSITIIARMITAIRAIDQTCHRIFTKVSRMIARRYPDTRGTIIPIKRTVRFEAKARAKSRV